MLLWGQLRKQVRSFIVPPLRGRIDIHCASYHEASDSAGEEWITVDKKRVFFGGFYHWDAKLPKELSEQISGCNYNYTSDEFVSLQTQSELVKAIQRAEIAGDNHIWRSLENYLQAPIQESLNSTNPIIRAFAIVDRRIGTRTIKNIELLEPEHSLVKLFYDLRIASMKKMAG